MNKPLKRTVICVVLYTLIVAKVGYAKRMEQVTPSIHCSSVVTEEHWTSSCAVVEEGVPVCQDPDDDVEALEDVNLSKTRTPYPEGGFDAIENVARGRGTAAGSPRRTPRTLHWLWWWWWQWPNGNDLNNRVEQEDEDHLQEETIDYDDTSSGPKTVVTYMIKGCSPTKVPYDLSPCSAHVDDDLRSPDHITSTRVIYYLPPSATTADESFPAPAKSSDDYDY